MYHNFFIHSPVNGHLGCFHVLTIVNSAAMKIRMHANFLMIVSFGYIPRSGVAGSYVSYIFSFFKGTSILFSIVAVVQSLSCVNY